MSHVSGHEKIRKRAVSTSSRASSGRCSSRASSHDSGPKSVKKTKGSLETVVEESLETKAGQEARTTTLSPKKKKSASKKTKEALPETNHVVDTSINNDNDQPKVSSKKTAKNNRKSSTDAKRSETPKSKKSLSDSVIECSGAEEDSRMIFDELALHKDSPSTSGLLNLKAKSKKKKSKVSDVIKSIQNYSSLLSPAAPESPPVKPGGILRPPQLQVDQNIIEKLRDPEALQSLVFNDGSTDSESVSSLRAPSSSSGTEVTTDKVNGVSPAKASKKKKQPSTKKKSCKQSSKRPSKGERFDITCAICNILKNYSKRPRRFGLLSCESCSKFFGNFLKAPQEFLCQNIGMISFNRCPTVYNLVE